MNKIIAICGATGFIGKKLCDKHLGLNDQVYYLTRNNPQAISVAKAIMGDVNSSAEQLMALFKGAHTFYNCAGELNHEQAMRATHVQGTINLLKTIEKYHLASKSDFHWVQLSSVGAYGQVVPAPNAERYVDENSAENPQGEYEITKTEADALIIAFAKTHAWFKYTIIRPTNVFGVGMRSVAIANMMRIIQKKLFFYVGHKQSVANFVHVDDVVSAMMLCANNPKAFNQTFIVSNDCSLQAVVNQISTSLNVKKPSLVINEKLLRTLEKILSKIVRLPLNQNKIDVLVRKTHYANHKIKTQLGWQPGDVLSQMGAYIKAVSNKNQ